MANSAFDLEKLGDYSQDYDHMFFYNLLYDMKIQNIRPRIGYDNEAYEEIAFQLYHDYKTKACNALGYLKEGMDARLLWELRKSGVLLWFMEHHLEFFHGHLDTFTWQEVKEYRSKFLAQCYVDYEDHDWQYFWVIKNALVKEQRDQFLIPGEDLFADGDPNKPDDLGDPIKDAVWYNAPPWIYVPKIQR